MSQFLVIGHRGAPDQAVENTEESFRSALDAGAHLIETDVRISADGHVVVAHDADFSRLGGPSTPIIRRTRAEIKHFELHDAEGRTARPLFMDEALELFPDISFNVDLKDSSEIAVEPWIALLRKTAAFQRCRTASFSDKTLRLFRKAVPEAPVSVAQMGAASLLFAARFGKPRKPDPSEGVMQLPEKAGPLSVVTPRTLDAWHRSGWKIHVWTVDNEKDMRRLMGWGVDGIITNRPSLLKHITTRAQ